MKKYILTLLIAVSCLSTTYSQILYNPTYNDVEVSNVASKRLTSKNNAIDTLSEPTLSEANKQQIEKAIKTTPIGTVIWSYFGEIIIGGISLLLIYIRVTIKEFFTKAYRKMISKTKPKENYTNEDIKVLGDLSDSVNGYLTKIKEITNAERVLLYQFSNGTHFFSSIPVLRMTVTNYSEGNSIQVTDNVFNYQTAQEIIHKILNEEYLEVKDTNTTVKYMGYTNYLQFAKFKNSTLVRVNVSDNYCGIIEIIEPETFTLDEVRSYSYAIGHLFEAYNKEKELDDKV